MRQIIKYIIFIFLAVCTGESYAQRSCVFLPEISGSTHTESEYDRPRVALHRIHPLSFPQPLGVNSAPDFPNINVSANLIADQDETSIAINPADPKNIIIGANDYRSLVALFHFQSFDGGLTWASGEFETNWTSAANPTDPAVAFNASGKAFYSYGRTETDVFPINDVICNTSTNGGKDWQLPVRVILDSIGFQTANTFADKYYVAVDNISGSPFKDRIYVAWAEYDLNKKDRIRLSFSTDDGKSWSLATYVTATGNFQSPIPATGSNGELYVAYENIDQSQREVHIARSLDGGKTFSLDKKIANYNDLGPMNPPGGPAAHPTIKGGLRVNSFPSIAVDHSGVHHGRVYMTWAAMGADNRHHIYLTISDDAGNSWSAPKTVENDPSPIVTDKFFPWIAVDDLTGDVGIAFYDSRADTANVLVDLWMLHSSDGGQKFALQRISSASSNVTASSSGLENFFGDYNGLAAHNKTWYPTWTDTRVGYDQDIYTAIVRPYAPSTPKNFIATEDNVSHLPDLSWDYTPATTYGASLGDFVFRLKRLDGGLSIDLPKSARSYNDLQAVKNVSYTYTLQVVTSDQDTSVAQIAPFSTRANDEPMPPLITSAKPQAASLLIFFRLPDKNAAGTALHNLYRIYYFINGVVRDSSTFTDAAQGKTFSFVFYNLQTEGYYNIQLAASTKNSNGDTILSVLSPAAWLYAGPSLPSYREDFDNTRTTFSPFAWDTTRASGKLPGNYINDSLPDIPYPKDINTWFLLPPVKMSDAAHTIEFSHIALVAPGDSALVEISTNDGLSFSYYTSYDKNSHQSDWGNDLAASHPVHEQIGLKHLIGQDAIIRFRLATHSSGGDGWFIDSIHFTDALSVPSSNNNNSFRASLSDNPLRIGAKGKINLYSDKPVSLTVNIYSVLGNKTETLLNNKFISEGEYELDLSPEDAGCYFYEVIARSAKGEERRYGKYVVVP